MDKIGPIARKVDDLAWIFAAIAGIDQRDPTLVKRGFQWPMGTEVAHMRIGVTEGQLNAQEQQVLALLRSEGAQIVDVDLQTNLPVGAMDFMLGVEAATVFDDSFRDDPKADYGRWPRTFRNAQFVPAVQYLRAARLRSQLIRDAERALAAVDVVVGGDDLLLTNLTGHPSLVVSCGSSKMDRQYGREEPQSQDDQGAAADVPTINEVRVPGVVKLTASAYRESQLLHVGKWIQQVLPPDPRQPPVEDWA